MLLNRPDLELIKLLNIAVNKNCKQYIKMAEKEKFEMALKKRHYLKKWKTKVWEKLLAELVMIIN